MQQELEGALIALAGFAVGRFIPGRRRRPKPPKPIKPICGCTHHKSMHDPETGKCNAGIKVDKYNSVGDHVGYEYPSCACLRYEGPIPADEYYAREIAP